MLQGLQTFVVTSHEPNASHFLAAPAKEWHAFYPNDNHDTRRTFVDTDSRDALAAFVAFKKLQEHNQDFKWMFLAPASTLFFVGAAHRVVEGLDWNQPHVLTGEGYHELCSAC